LEPFPAETLLSPQPELVFYGEDFNIKPLFIQVITEYFSEKKSYVAAFGLTIPLRSGSFLIGRLAMGKKLW
jgi:hypothetical protein